MATPLAHCHRAGVESLPRMVVLFLLEDSLYDPLVHGCSLESWGKKNYKISILFHFTVASFKEITTV